MYKSKDMKILIINQHKEDALGGSEIQCDLIAKYLTKFGHEVVYGAINGRFGNYYGKYRVVALKSLPDDVENICQEFEPHVVYWRYNKRDFRKNAKAINNLKIPIVFGISHINDLKRFSFKTYNGTILKKTYRYFNQIIRSVYNYGALKYVQGVVAQNEEQYKLTNLTNKILIRNSMENNLVEFEWKRPYCVWVANIKKSKNPEEFIRLAEYFEHLEIDFLMVGKVQDESYEYIKEGIGVPKNLFYLGAKSLEEVNGIIKNSMFLVHTCNPEGFPNNLIQAWKNSKPTISLYYDPDNLISEQGLGLYSKSTEQMKIDVESLIENKQLRDEFGKRAYLFSNHNFDPNVNIRKLENFLLKIVRN